MYLEGGLLEVLRLRSERLSFYKRLTRQPAPVHDQRRSGDERGSVAGKVEDRPGYIFRRSHTFERPVCRTGHEFHRGQLQLTRLLLQHRCIGITGADTTPDELDNKLVVTAPITKTIENAGGDERLRITHGGHHNFTDLLGGISDAQHGTRSGDLHPIYLTTAEADALYAALTHAGRHTDGSDDIQDAVDDGSTKGIAGFEAADFDAVSGIISLEGAVLKAVYADSGTAQPVGHSLAIGGGTGITTSASGPVITIAGHLQVHGFGDHAGRIIGSGADLPGSGADGEFFYLTTDQHPYIYQE